VLTVVVTLAHRLGGQPHHRVHVGQNAAHAGVDPVATTGAGVSSWAACTGDAAGPLRRNRSCLFADLIFRPPATFLFAASERVDGAALRVFLDPRFGGGSVTSATCGEWAPTVVPAAAVHRVTKVIDTPVFIGRALHGNVGHNMLDVLYPVMVAMLSLKHAATPHAGNRGDQMFSTVGPATAATSEQLLSTVPDARNDSFRYLIFDDSECCPTVWRGRKWEQEFARRFAGELLGVQDLEAECPHPGCVVRRAVAGVGHLGLSMVDVDNVVGGARIDRSLWRFRERVLARLLPPSTPRHPPADEAPLAVFVQTKRVVRNLQAVAEAVGRALGVRTKVLSWEGMPFVEQLELLRRTAVLVSGVGTAQMNALFLPEGAVAVCLGRVESGAERRIAYFDSHILHSLDHIRAIYYPSYDHSETPSQRGGVVLDIAKAVKIVRHAVELHRTGFRVPVDPSENANAFDRAYATLAERTGGLSHRGRTGDVAFTAMGGKAACSAQWKAARGQCMCNAVEEVLFGDRGSKCGWGGNATKVIREYGL